MMQLAGWILSALLLAIMAFYAGRKSIRQEENPTGPGDQTLPGLVEKTTPRKELSDDDTHKTYNLEVTLDRYEDAVLRPHLSTDDADHATAELHGTLTGIPTNDEDGTL